MSAACWRRRERTVGLSVIVFATLALTLRAAPTTTAQSAPAAQPARAKSALPIPDSWLGIWRSEGQTPKNDPPGFKTRFPYWDLNGEIDAHLTPAALDKKNRTDPDEEDSSQVCQLQGMFREFNFFSISWMAAPGKIVLQGGFPEVAGIRRIYHDSPHPANLTRTWLGDSRSHWEGDTLVIDTIGFNGKPWLMNDRQPSSEALHVVERVRLVAGGNSMEILTTVEDSGTLKSSYSYSRYYHRQSPAIGLPERVCNENADNIWHRRRKAARAQPK